MRRVAVGFACFCSFSAGCAEPTVATFEDFYAATTKKDVAAVRALLCPPARKALADVPDAEVAEALQPRRVVRRVFLKSEIGGSAILAVEDATGQQTNVGLTADPSAPRGWCVDAWEMRRPREAELGEGPASGFAGAGEGLHQTLQKNDEALE
jgi:hypothetical protein